MLNKKSALTALSLVLLNCGSDHDKASGRADDPNEGPNVAEAYSSSDGLSIGAGGSFACRIIQGGKVLCWGDNVWGKLGDGTTVSRAQAKLVSGITTATALSVGQAHACALLSDGTVKCWGYGGDGNLGNGGTTDSSVPVTVSGISTAIGIAAGGNAAVTPGSTIGSHTCALLSDGTAKCWGSNSNGQLGIGSMGGIQATPQTVTGLSNATGIVTGGWHTCVTISGGTVKCWGYNASGQLGIGSFSDKSSPQAVSGLSNVASIGAGGFQTCARLTDSTLKCWGGNSYGQVGDGSKIDRNTPQTISGLSNVASVSAGHVHTCVRLSTGSVKCWGHNDYGGLGNGTTTTSTTPVSVSGITTAAQLAAGYTSTCVLLTDGTMKCWGNNYSGQLASGTSGDYGAPTLVRPQTMNKVMDVATGGLFTCVLWDTGSVKCFGSNSRGQLGNGTTTDSKTPVDVTGITTAKAIAAGFSHVCVLLTDSTIKCWGKGGDGNLGNGKTLDSSTPVTVSGITTAVEIGMGIGHGCARLSDGTVKCWGLNQNGELGNNSTKSSSTPVTVSGISNATSIAGGGTTSEAGHSCAVLSTGSVKCWGRGNFGQLGNGGTASSKTPVSVTGITTATQVTGHANTSCARLSDSTVKCWGSNVNGELGNGTTTNSSTPVSVTGVTDATALSPGAGSAYHVCARLSNKNVQCWGYGAHGQLGYGYAQFISPSAGVVSGVHRAMTVRVGNLHTCITNDDSTLECWGSDEYGQQAQSSVIWSTTPISPACSAIDVERSDYFVNITTANMPDTNFNGLAAQLDTHRVKPVFYPETCTATEAAVLTHGRTVEAVSAFDLQYQDYSFMEQLAREGIDTVAFNHLGMGRSAFTSATNPFDDACNGSLPSCLETPAPDGGFYTCPPPNGVLCDCAPAPTFGVNDRNQQGSTKYLNPNPLTSLCAHTTNTRFINTTTMVADLDAVIDDTLSKTGLSQVNVLGYSAGGVDVGNWLGVADNTLRAARQAKVAHAIFVASLFGQTTTPFVPDNEPAGGSAAQSYAMGVMDRGNAIGGGFNLNAPTCPGQRDDGIVGPIWEAVKARDSVGSTWGPSQAPTENGGLSRYPQATRWGWTAAAAARITVPVLVMQGLKDNVVNIASSTDLHAKLTGTSKKTLVQIGCGSHSIFWEGCSGAQCNGWTGAHASVRKHAIDWIKTGFTYASPGSDNGTFETSGTDGTNAHTAGGTTVGPAADENNQMP
jgi:alpha-tubulin suppressor-like RCC1 family protein/pimeloyl-ACP methyl ester carboxylesterase